jgi:hypothetical protein
MNEPFEFHLSLAGLPRASRPLAKALGEMLSGTQNSLNGKAGERLSSARFLRQPPHGAVKGNAAPVGGKDVDEQRHQKRVPSATDAQIAQAWSKACQAAGEATANRGREAHALKAMHDYLKMVGGRKDKSQQEMALIVQDVIAQLRRIKDWDKPQWFKKQPATLRDAAGRMVSEHEMVQQRNHLTSEQIGKWDDWAENACKMFALPAVDAHGQIAALDEYIVRKVAVDSIKNWLRRRPAEPLVNDMFGALATNRLYVNSSVHLRTVRDESGAVRAVETRDGQLYFEGSEELVVFKEDENGTYVDLPEDCDMIVFERRTISGVRQIVPVAQPNGRDPNIQWFTGPAVKRGWQKEQRFFSGPDCMALDELYGFFPDHFPMRLTNSVENRIPTEKVGGAIYGYAKEHSGRQARQLIAEFGEVMPGLKRNNSQLINDARQLFGLQRGPVERPLSGERPAAI